VFALVVTSLVWAFSFGLIRHHLKLVDPDFVAFARLALAALLLLPWLRARRVRAVVAARLARIGAVQFGLMYLFYLEAFRYLQAYHVVLLTVMTPIWVCLSEDALRRAFSYQPIVAAAVAVLGAGIVLGGSSLGRTPWSGILLIQASNACFAFGQVWYRRLVQREHNFDQKAMFGWLYWGAVAIVMPLGLSHLPANLMHLTLREFLVILYLGLVASGVGFFLWNYGAARVSAPVLAVMNNAKTPLGLFVSLVFFGESVQITRLIVGSALVVAATAYAQRVSSHA
jgi:drug/metabolite transporter (DMT)-like permease